MARFEDTPGLFGVGGGGGTYGNISCEYCGTAYGNRESAEGEATADESIGVVVFGKKQVCDCCFEEIEEAVLSHMGDILPWFLRILQTQKQRFEQREGFLEKIKDALK